MNQAPTPSPATPAPPEPQTTGWWGSAHWVPFVLPLAVFMLAGSLEPAGDKPVELLGLSWDASAYPLLYAGKILATILALAAVWPGYRAFRWQVSPLAPLIGVVGVVLWIVICKLQLETALLKPLGLEATLGLGERAGFNPFARWPDQPAAVAGFLAVRFLGLALVVPIIEEFFLRGFLMRFVITAEWWKVPFGTLTPLAIVVGTVFPMLTHPAELFAAAVWFSLVTWLMHRTRNIWDCVVAHAVTNLLLGVYVVLSGEWHFW